MSSKVCEKTNLNRLFWAIRNNLRVIKLRENNLELKQKNPQGYDKIRKKQGLVSLRKPT